MPDANSAIEHFSNSVEYVLFTEGWISLRVGEQEYFLETEDALCNNASLSHCYINNVIGYTRSADFHLILRVYCFGYLRLAVSAVGRRGGFAQRFT